jgi:ribosomal protein L6P/L9E
MIRDMERMIDRLRTLSKTSVRIRAIGRYPVKRNTEVAAVAVYQNDGTETISPSHFVERAAAAEGDWADEIADAIAGTVEGYDAALQVLGAQVAADIGDMCDRIDTGRLKKSFRGDVEQS